MAEAVQQGLGRHADVEVWTQGVFDLSEGTLESLLRKLDTADYAVFILTADDLCTSRGTEEPSPRDNVIFELGLFFGRLNRNRCFFLLDETRNIKLPSDLLGVTAATFRPHHSGNLEASVGPACTKIKRAVEKHGRRSKLLLRILDGAITDMAVPDLTGVWAGFSPDGPEPSTRNSTLEIEQRGGFVQAIVTRDVQDGQRVFEYEGRLASGQLLLFFEDLRGRGYIVGTMVLQLSGDLRTLSGRTTYYHHTLGEVVSNQRVFRRL
ncbi:MAG: nucleotide-binding protein [Polyangiaceae bacterium]